ncbi:hypothetical protein [Photobacterium sanguinicancri]|uniref:hypothetical protein n=1 Tax=Photobacterium sanguinicancri TaxID=875932 RepID=UPI0026E1A3AB|nr:hypothetical protein [Photobacterium sanguinicancri]MDO6500918.1 hypothetical protein [Photobacterium sanguinicancri]
MKKLAVAVIVAMGVTGVTAANAAYVTQQGHVQQTNKKDSEPKSEETNSNWDVYFSGGVSTYSEEDYTNDGFGFNIGAIKDGYQVGFIYGMDIHSDTIGSTGLGIVSGSVGLMLRPESFDALVVYPMIGYTVISTSHSRYGTEMSGGINYGIGGSLELFDSGLFVETNYKVINSDADTNPTEFHIGVGYKF